MTDEQIAKKKSSTSQASTAPQLVVDGDIDNENGCSHLSIIVMSYGMEWVHYWSGWIIIKQTCAIASSNDLDVQRFSATPAFVVYKCV